MTGVPPQPGSEIALRVPAGSFGSGFGAYIFFTIFGGIGPGSAGTLTSFLAAVVAEPDRRSPQPEKAALGLAPPSSGGTLGAAKDIVSKAAEGRHSMWWWLAVAASALLALVCTLVLLTSGRRGPRPRIS